MNGADRTFAALVQRQPAGEAFNHLQFAVQDEVDVHRVVLAWRRSFTRYEAIAALRNAIYACELPGVTRLS